MPSRSDFLDPARNVASGALLATLLALSPKAAHADTLIIKHPGDHARYSFEAEPHLLVGVVDPPGPARGSGFGLGFRGTIPLLDNGFIPNINNSIGIGFGLDFARYGEGSYCAHYDNRGSCDDYHRNDGFNEFFLPVVMQWNFFLSRKWSVFGEPGFAINFHSWDANEKFHFDPFVLFVGGRYHFSDNVTLTMRIGYPTVSVGCSFFL